MGVDVDCRGLVADYGRMMARAHDAVPDGVEAGVHLCATATPAAVIRSNRRTHR
jgi:hypothetical protein